MAAILPSAPIVLFEEYLDPKADDFLAIVEIASGKTKKIKAQYFGQTAPSTNYKWVSGFDYPEDAIVDYNGQWYLSLQTPNLGKTPNAQPLYWELQTKAAQGFVFWEAGVYTGDPVLVMYEISAGNVQIYRLIEATRPFLSSDFESELAGGDWEIISAPGAAVPPAFEPWDGSGDAVPIDADAIGSGAAGAIIKGDSFYLTAAGSFDPDGAGAEVWPVKTLLIAKQNSPTTAAHYLFR